MVYGFTSICCVQIEAETESHKSRVRLRNGLIIGGVTGATIVAALATIRYRRRHH